MYKLADYFTSAKFYIHLPVKYHEQQTKFNFYHINKDNKTVNFHKI
jgi:hypothetical protein